jgi:membrane peptidoglycan carboxypeptidase
MAMYGGPDYVTEPLNNVTQAVAQAGSTFKVFALTAAMEAGTPLDYLLPGKSGTVIAGYKVNNYSGETFGDITLLQATEHSVNTAYVQLAQDLGIDNVMNMAYRMGLPEDTSGIDRNLTFVLGSPSPHVINMAEAYATLASRGVHATPYLLKSVKSSSGTEIYQSQIQSDVVMAPEVTDQVTYALQQVVLHGTGVNAKAAGRPVAGKTGTTDESKSAWFVGYTPEMATAVMMMKQNSKGIPVSMYGVGGLASVTGGSFPTKIWGQFMRDALKGVPVSKFPAPTASPTITDSATPGPTDSSTDTATPAPTAS